MQLILDKLHMLGLLSSKHTNDVSAMVCCDPESRNCLLNECGNCKAKTVSITIPDYQKGQHIFYYKWTPKQEKCSTTIKDKFIEVRIISKEKIACSIEQLLQELQTTLPPFLRHVSNMKHQAAVKQELKNNLSPNKVLIEMDFSQNYVTKFGREPQSLHFGASKKQITMHTSITYMRDATGAVRCVSSCTMSECLRHDPSAIWAHVHPTVEHAIAAMPAADTIQFFTDGSTIQYRNKKNFFLFTTHLPSIFHNVKFATWNFMEAGHGKGSEDAVGGILEHTADALVSRGEDIPDCSHLLKQLTLACPSIRVRQVFETEVEEIDRKLPPSLRPIPQPMALHQLTWSASEPLTLNVKLVSCFCNTMCSHFLCDTSKWSWPQSAELVELSVCDFVIVDYEWESLPGKITGK